MFKAQKYWTETGYAFYQRYRLSHISDRQRIFPILHHHGSNSRFKKYWVKPDGTGPQRQLRFQVHHHYTQGPISITSLQLQLGSRRVSGAVGTLTCRHTARRTSAPAGVHKSVHWPALVDKCISAIHGGVLRAPESPCLRPSQLIYVPHTLVWTHQVRSKTRPLGCKHRQDVSRWRGGSTSKGRGIAWFSVLCFSCVCSGRDWVDRNKVLPIFIQV